MQGASVAPTAEQESPKLPVVGSNPTRRAKTNERLNMRSTDEIKELFGYHPPSSEKIATAHTEVRMMCENLALDLFNLCPSCAETTLALRSVHQAMMHANTAIAVNQSVKRQPNI